MTTDGLSATVVLRIANRKLLTAKQLMTRGMYRICRESDFTWRYVANLGPWFAYHRMQKSLTPVQQLLVTDLKRDGIAISSVEQLMGKKSPFEELESEVNSCEASLADEISQARTDAGKPDRVKSYCFHLLGRSQVWDLNSIFLRFAVQRVILDIANAYFGMLTRLLYYNVWHNLPMQAEARESQLWHRDPEDRHILKVFVYLTDVDYGSGPLSYAPGTHALGPVKTVPESRLLKEGSTYVRRSDDVQMSAVIPREKWITALGPKGTIVFVDTRGYHKGGLVREHDRVVYTCMFNSQASAYPLRHELSVSSQMDKAVAFAIRG
jgi:Phytanoyl-CoA dioxygenase (PhyH)